MNSNFKKQLNETKIKYIEKTNQKKKKNTKKLFCHHQKTQLLTPFHLIQETNNWLNIM
jgi:NADH:ubiquinone oxidoreductase subunit E